MILVLFDVDGTLLDAGGSGRWAMTRAFEEVFGIQDAAPYAHTVRFDGMTDPGILMSIARNAGIDRERLEREAAVIQQAFLRHLEARLHQTPGRRVLPGVIDLLDRLAGVRLASVGLLTGNIEAGARLKLSSVGLSDYFDMGGFGDDAADRAGIGRVARSRFECRLDMTIAPADVVVVGDSTEDVRAGKINGYRTLAVGTGWGDHEEIRAMEPDLFLPDLTDYGGVMQFIFGTRGAPGR